ncbi:putative nepenthesin [Helianthus annuus]|uniref:Nepenthesin n=1 Tax=Helianthus annuus TaxID=4232 RepID=A0A9K3DE25_HELAN|nr:probable aspartic proteinase GIP2 [Helianthus annuus]KAF5753674.1 putative nepenthesin [Helianthus annuus]KAJ0634838.1 putative nepenthesin [Helianthus annuus]KAJ0824534.1 putative nepenthesin [Helianthus annuus]
MASSQTLTTLFIFSLLTISYAATDPFKLTKQTNIHFPIRKNQTSLQYYTTFEAGNPQSRTKVDALIDLGAQTVFFDCQPYVSSSYKRAACRSNRCKKALGSVCLWCNSTPRPGCFNNSCGVNAFNPLTGAFAELELGEDTVRVTSSDGHSIRLNYDVPKFQFLCAYLYVNVLYDLPGSNTAKGLVGLARTQVSLVSQISSLFSVAKKFALCIPSDKGLGDIFIGGGPYYMPPRTEDQSLNLSSTLLVINPVRTSPVSAYGEASDDYFINVKTIEIDGKRVSFNSSLLSIDSNGVGGTMISTVVPYTTLHSSIYEPLVKDFVKVAAVDGIKRVASVAPFGACFDAKTAPKTIAGPAVPDIDLVLEGKTIVRFKMYGSNTMVEAKKNVICLAFVDGGAEPRTSIVLGGHQLENRVLEFDLAASKLGFTNSLLILNTTCSQHRQS